MRVLIQQNILLLQLLGEQPVHAASEYRPISFCVLLEADGVAVAYNTLTGELIEPMPEEVSALRATCGVSANAVTERLIRKWFLVPKEHDDLGLALEVRTLARDLLSQKGKREFTILTTTDCNARCFYCYELGIRRVPMSEQTAQDAAAFIIKTCGSEKACLNWFGGEPLYNAGVIDIICTALRDAGVEYRSTMVSNGYLFDGETIRRAKELWRLRRVQITLDGTEAVYNKAKAFIYKDGRSAFRVVTDNIERLLQSGIRVSVRMNMGEHNKEDLYALVDWLCERYSERELLSAYPHLLFDYTQNRIVAQDSAARLARAQELLAFEQYCADKGLLRAAPIENEIKINHCMADSPRAVTILPSGKIGKCEHFAESEFVGDIYSGVDNAEKVAEFSASLNNQALCGGCPVFPRCIRLKKCPDEGEIPCDAAKRLIEETALKRRVAAAYRAAKERLAKEAAEKDAAAERTK